MEDRSLRLVLCPQAAAAVDAHVGDHVGARGLGDSFLEELSADELPGPWMKQVEQSRSEMVLG